MGGRQTSNIALLTIYGSSEILILKIESKLRIISKLGKLVTPRTALRVAD